MTFPDRIPTRAQLEEALEVVGRSVHRTPLLRSRRIDEALGCCVMFKCENFQKTGSFKARGAVFALSTLEPEIESVATHSSGNHGQALAWAAQQSGRKAYIAVPNNAPQVKLAAMREYGGEILLCAPTAAAREAALQQLVEMHGAHAVPPFDDFRIVAGQSTVFQEALSQMRLEGKEPHAVVAPVGGGGLMAGTALAAEYFAPDCAVWAGEPEGADDTARSMVAGQRLPMIDPQTIADGLRTGIGVRNFGVLQPRLKGVLRVSDAEILGALRWINQALKIVVEPSCAVPLAALFRYPEYFQAQTVLVILSGGNTDG
ncbi:pyridoxal-phosphate dependent enzyme [bacterium]|nr:pyridoxal-phosphate dependent enzyme [bacterium]